MAPDAARPAAYTKVAVGPVVCQSWPPTKLATSLAAPTTLEYSPTPKARGCFGARSLASALPTARNHVYFAHQADAGLIGRGATLEAATTSKLLTSRRLPPRRRQTNSLPWLLVPSASKRARFRSRPARTRSPLT